MRGLIALLAIAALGTGTGGVTADEGRLSAGSVAQLVTDLSSRTRAVREAAERELMRADGDVLELLPAPRDVADAAARNAIRRIRVALELRAAEQSVLPSRVTLIGSRTLAEIVSALADQSGNAVSLEHTTDEIRNQRLSPMLEQTPFWDALQRVATAAGVSWKSRANGGLVLSVPEALPASGREVVATTVAGAFFVTVEAVSRSRETVRVDCSVVGEPRLRLLFAQVADEDFTAATRDTMLPPLSPLARREIPVPSHEPVRFSILFQDASAEMEILSLRGAIVMQAAAAPVEFRFSDLAGAGAGGGGGGAREESQRRGGVTITRSRARFAIGAGGDDNSGKGEARIALSVAYDAGGPAFESHRTWLYHNQAALEGPDGTRYAVKDFDLTAQSDGGVGIDYRWSGLPALPASQWAFVYVAPTRLIDTRVEFAFEQLPIPGL